MALRVDRAARDVRNHRRKTRLIMIVIRRLTATRRAGLRTRLHLVDAYLLRLCNLGVVLTAALGLRDLVAIGMRADQTAACQPQTKRQAIACKSQFEKLHVGLRD